MGISFLDEGGRNLKNWTQGLDKKFGLQNFCRGPEREFQDFSPPSSKKDIPIPFYDDNILTKDT